MPNHQYVLAAVAVAAEPEPLHPRQQSQPINMFVHTFALQMMGDAMFGVRLKIRMRLSRVRTTISTLCCIKVYHQTSKDNFNRSCQIPVIYGTVITK